MPAPLLPGERVVTRVRPSPWSMTVAYLRAAGLGIYGGLLWALFSAAWWADHEPGPWYRFWTYLYGNIVVGHLYMAVGLAGATLLVGLAMRRPWWAALGLGVAMALAVSLTSLLLDPHAYPRTLPLLLAAASLVALALVEVDRRLRSILFTNVRCIARGGLWDRAGHAVRYADLADIDIRQGPLGLALGFGDLYPTLQAHAEETEARPIRGIRPVTAGRDLLAAMTQQATSTPQMQKANHTRQRLEDAARRLGVQV